MPGLRLVGEVTLDGAGFERGLARIGQSAANNLKSLAVSAFGIYGIEQAIHKTVESASDLVDESQRLSISVEMLQVLRQAAKDAGTEMGTLTSAFERYNAIRGNILSGGKGSADQLAALKRLGVTEDMLRNLTAQQAFTGPLAKTVQGSNPADIAADMKKIFGRAFGELIPVLKTDFDDLSAKMKTLGSIMSGEDAVALDMLGDNFSLLSNILTANVAPGLIWFVEKVLEAAGQIKGASSFWGDLAGKRGGTGGLIRDTAEAALLKVFNRFRRPGPEQDENREWIAKWDSDVDAAGETFNATMDTFKKTIDEVKERIKNDADKLKNPKPQKVDFEPVTPKAKKAKLYDAKGDVLIDVGNFLGAARGGINGVAERHLEVSREQLAEQKTTNTHLQELVNKAGDRDDLDIPD